MKGVRFWGAAFAGSLLVACAGGSAAKLHEEAKFAEKDGRPEAALRKYREAIAADPENVEIHRDYQNLRRKVDGPQAVRDEYRRRRDENPKSAPAAYLYGRLLEKEELEREMKRSIELDPEFPWPRMALALYFGHQKRWSDAMVHLEHVLSRQEHVPAAIRLEAALCAMNLQRDDMAERQLLLAREENPRSAAPDFYLGALRLSQNKPLEAAAALEEALRKDPSWHRAFSLLARAYVRLGRIEEVERVRRLAREFTRTARDAEAKEELKQEFVLARSQEGGWSLTVYDRIDPPAQDPWVLQLVAEGQTVTITYRLFQMQDLSYRIERTIRRRGDGSRAENDQVWPVEKDDFATFYRRASSDLNSIRSRWP